jgi:hypothetical protein
MFAINGREAEWRKRRIERDHRPPLLLSTSSVPPSGWTVVIRHAAGRHGHVRCFSIPTAELDFC